MSKRKIISTVINNYDSDQRVQKVGNSLQKFGFDFEVVATNLRGEPKLSFPYPLNIIKLNHQTGMAMYLDFNWKLFWKLLKITKKEDILLANDVDALLPNYLIHKIKGVQLVFDSHEIFSELPSLRDRKLKKKIWKSIESFIVPRLKNFYTVSNGYAEWFKNEYGILPKVIMNVPMVNRASQEELKVKLPEKQPNEKVLIYQGVINFSRGIDKMIQAMQYLENTQLWIIGNGPKKKEFEQLSFDLNLNQKIKFFGNIPPSQLKLITPHADLGLSLEEDFGLSYRFALPNKVFDYCHAGIPILGTYLPEIKTTIENYKIGICIENHEPNYIAQKIKEMLVQGKEYYKENLQKAAQDFNWENEEKKLFEIYTELT